MGEWVQYLQETLTTPLSLVIVGAGFFGLLMGWLISRPAHSGEVSESEVSNDAKELQWRHEKLVLLERQEVEREWRLENFLNDMAISHGGTATEVRSRLFALAEGIRSMRGRVGSDFSRFSLVKERLCHLKEQGAPREEALDACIEMAEGQIEKLRSLRERIRPIGEVILKMDRELSGGELRLPDGKDEMLELAGQVRVDLVDLSSGWSLLTDETDRGIRDLLAAGQEPVYEPLRQILLVDGAVTGSLKQAPSVILTDEADGLLKAIKGIQAPQEPMDQADEPVEESTFGEPSQFAGFQPAPLQWLPSGGESNGSSFDEEKDAEAHLEDLEAVEEEAAHDSIVLFRSNDAGLWGQDIYRGANCRARALPALPAWAKWIAIKRGDTGERVFSPIDAEMFAHGGNGDATGFNASNELFYGARHLGMFSENCPNEVETRFTYGGWGFGHRVSDVNPDPETLQASAWEGVEIPADTVFEISLFEELPQLEPEDQVIGR